jgi:SAM-dependent methyltransferase
LSDQAVGHLYDALSALEAPYRAGIAYPVHKRLRFPESDARDIYDWICAHVDLPRSGRILDAGCGVGFGTIRLAQVSACRVDGISLSGVEVTRASQAARESNLTERVAFRQSSFDDVPAATYDLVIAVESLKHSSNLGRSLHTLRNSVRKGGQLVIVEDLYMGAETGAFVDQIVADWSLRRLYTEADFLAHLGGAQCRIVDLTGCVPPASRSGVVVRRAALALALPFATRHAATALRAFRGGLNLQRLYADGAMTYKGIIWRESAG